MLDDLGQLVAAAPHIYVLRYHTYRVQGPSPGSFRTENNTISENKLSCLSPALDLSTRAHVIRIVIQYEVLDVYKRAHNSEELSTAIPDMNKTIGQAKEPQTPPWYKSREEQGS